MFSRFTEKQYSQLCWLKRKLKFHHNYVGTEHLLLGLIGEQDNVVTKVIKEMGVTPEQIRSALEDRIEYGGLRLNRQIYRLLSKRNKCYLLLGIKPENLVIIM